MQARVSPGTLPRPGLGQEPTVSPGPTHTDASPPPATRSPQDASVDGAVGELNMDAPPTVAWPAPPEISDELEKMILLWLRRVYLLPAEAVATSMETVQVHTDLIPFNQVPSFLKKALRQAAEAGQVGARAQSPTILRVHCGVLRALAHYMVHSTEMPNSPTSTHGILALMRGLTYGFASPGAALPPIRPVVTEWPGKDDLDYYNHLCLWTFSQSPLVTDELVSHLTNMPTPAQEAISPRRLQWLRLADSSRRAHVGYDQELASDDPFDRTENPVWHQWFRQLLVILSNYANRPPVRLHDLCSHPDVQTMVPPFHSIHPDDKVQLLPTPALMDHPMCIPDKGMCQRCERQLFETPDDWSTRHRGHYFVSQQCKCDTVRYCLRCTLEDWLYRALTRHAPVGHVPYPADSEPLASTMMGAAYPAAHAQVLWGVRCHSCQTVWSPVTLLPIFLTYKDWFTSLPHDRAAKKVVDAWESSYKSSGRRGLSLKLPSVVAPHLHPVPEFGASHLKAVPRKRSTKPPKTTKHLATHEVVVKSPFFRAMSSLGPVCSAEDLEQARSTQMTHYAHRLPVVVAPASFGVGEGLSAPAPTPALSLTPAPAPATPPASTTTASLNRINCGMEDSAEGSVQGSAEGSDPMDVVSTAPVQDSMSEEIPLYIPMAALTLVDSKVATGNSPLPAPTAATTSEPGCVTEGAEGVPKTSIYNVDHSVRQPGSLKF